jgi:hypothetical protein
MRPLKGELLLEAWECGTNESDLARPLAMLSTSSDGCRPSDELAELSIAERDIELLRLRRTTFGDALKGYVPCGACATRVEFETSVQSMLDQLEMLRPRTGATWHAGRFTFTMRPVTSCDLEAIISATDPRLELLKRCISVEAEQALLNCESIAIEHFNRLNAGGETQFMLRCPACGAITRVEFDIGRFLWTEVRHAAINLLRDIHDLASAYGWSEASILAMAPARRAIYLEITRT